MRRIVWGWTVAMIFQAVCLAGMTLSMPSTEQSPKIDGQLGSGEWDRAAEVTGFRPCDDGDRARFLTVGRRAFVTYDADRLYFAFQTSGQLPGDLAVGADHGRDAAIFTGESVELHLTADKDPARKVQLIVAPDGTVFDSRNRDATWNSDIQPACALTADGWTAEFSVSWKSLGLDPSARNLDFLVVHNIGFPDGISSWVWSDNLTNFHNCAAYPELRPAGKNVAGWLQNIEFDAQRQPILTVRAVNRGDKPETVTAALDFVRGNLVRDDYPVLRASATIPAGESADLRLAPQLALTEAVDGWVSVTAADGAELYRYRVPLEYVSDSPVSWECKNYLPVGQIGVIFRSRAKDTVHGSLTLLAPDGRELASEDWEIPSGVSEHTLKLKAAPSAGNQQLQCRITLPEGKVAEMTQSLPYQKTPDWVGNTLGLEHEVVPPYTPVTYENGTLGMLAGKYEFGAGFLPQQILAGSQKLLQAPLRLTARREGHELTWRLPPLQVVQRWPDRVELAAQGRLGEWDCSVVVTMDEDGFLWYQIALAPEARLDGLALEIPLQRQIAEYIYPIDFSWTNYARVLNGADWKSPFMPAVSVYNDDCGLAWYCESQEIWNNAASDPLTLQFSGDQARFQAVLIDKADTGIGSAPISFGLQLTPPKPVDPALRLRRESHWAGFDEEKNLTGGSGAILYELEKRFDAQQGCLTMRLYPELTGTTTVWSLADAKGKLARLQWLQEKPGWQLQLADSAGVLQPVPEVAAALPLADVNRKWLTLTVRWDGKQVGLYENDRLIAAREENGLSVRPFDPATLRLEAGQPKLNGETSTFLLEQLTLAGKDGTLFEDRAAPIVNYRTPAGGESIGVVVLEDCDGTSAWRMFGTTIEYRLGCGSRYANFHQTWAKCYGEMYPEEPLRAQKLREVVQAYHDQGALLGIYVGGGLGDNSPMSHFYHDFWMMEPDRRWIPDSTWNSTWVNYLDHRFSAGCNGSDYWTDYMAYCLDRVIADFDVDNFYYDGAMFGGACCNRAHGCGYYDRDGVLQKTFPLRKIHRNGKRLYHLLLRRKPAGSIINHYSGDIFPVAGAWCTSTLLGEEYMIHKSGFEVDLADFRAKFYGRQFGAATQFLVYLNAPFSAREAMAYTLLHDINYGAFTPEALEWLAPVWRVLDNFPVTAAQWLPYWRNSEFVRVVEPESPRVVASLYWLPGHKVLAVVGNLTPENHEVKLRFDWEKLGIPAGEAVIRRLLPEAELELHDGTVTVAIPGNDFALVEITRQED